MGQEITWQAYVVGILSGMAGGIISPFIVSWLQDRFIWRKRKTIEIRQRVFDTTVKALTTFAAEALDSGLQAQHPECRGNYITPATKQALQEARALVQAFCSKEAYNALFDVMGERLTIADAPSIEWERKKTKAILIVAREIGITCGGNQS